MYIKLDALFLSTTLNKPTLGYFLFMHMHLYPWFYIWLLNCTAMPDDGKLDTESDSGEFWVLFGGFAPIGKKVASEDDIIPEATPAKLYRYFPLPLFYLRAKVRLSLVNFLLPFYLIFTSDWKALIFFFNLFWVAVATSWNVKQILICLNLLSFTLCPVVQELEYKKSLWC